MIRLVEIRGKEYSLFDKTPNRRRKEDKRLREIERRGRNRDGSQGKLANERLILRLLLVLLRKVTGCRFGRRMAMRTQLPSDGYEQHQNSKEPTKRLFQPGLFHLFKTISYKGTKVKVNCQNYKPLSASNTIFPVSYKNESHGTSPERKAPWRLFFWLCFIVCLRTSRISV